MDSNQSLEQPGQPDNSASQEGQEDHAARLHLILELPPGTRVRLTVEASPSAGEIDSAPVTLSIHEDNPAQASIDNGTGSKIRLTGGEKPVTLTLEGAASPPRLSEAEEPVSNNTRAVPGAATRSLSHSATFPAALPAALSRLKLLSASTLSLEKTLFALALSIYLAVHLIGLVDYPIYFFTDEAVQTVLAADLVRDGLRDYEKVFLPTYFKNGTQYNLSTSVYLQVAPYLLFGKSVFVTRATSVLVSLLAAVCVGLILRDFFKIPYWWAGTLLLSLAPAWFLHSRTAFETVLMVSFYTAALYFYLLYRYRSPGYLYACLIMAALAFYSYSPGQVVVAVTGLLLLVSDARYHWQNRSTILRGALLVVLLALPYLRFQLLYPAAVSQHLRNLSSYWVQPVPLAEKLSRFTSEYLYGLSPGYWFIPNERDLARHRMDGYGHLLFLSLPLIFLGLLRVLKGLRSSANRAVLITALAAPSGAALAQIGITRALSFVIPATLFAALGLDWILISLEDPKRTSNRLAAAINGIRPFGRAKADSDQRVNDQEIADHEIADHEIGTDSPRSADQRTASPALSIAVFSILALANFWLLRSALVNGPTWYRDYGLGGMQYGARQLFAAVKEYTRSHPGVPVIVSPTWANGTDVIARFFFPDPLPFQMGSVVGHLDQRLPLNDETLFVMTPDEIKLARESGKFSRIEVEKSLSYPDGQPGFYFTHLRYTDTIDAILAKERLARQELVSGEIEWQGQTVQVKYSPLDIGEIWNAFDGDTETVIRTSGANPLVIDMQFSSPVSMSGLYLRFGSAQIKVTARLATASGQVFDKNVQFTGSVSQPDGVLELGQEIAVQSLLLQVLDPHQGDPGHIHLWEIELR